jgi:ribosomal protein L11 methyltransferase
MWRATVAVPAARAAGFVRALEQGAVSVALFDADEAVARRAIGVEPGSWASDLWVAETCLVEALYDSLPDSGALGAALALVAASAGSAVPALALERVEERDWVAATNAAAVPITAGRYVVLPGREGEAPAGRSVVRMVATTAFGTGHHETTQGCLLALDRLARRRAPRRVLDLGTGTGVLAIAAARTWPARLLATDIDARAVRAARVNIRANGLGPRIRTAVAPGWRHRLIRAGGPWDLVLANILARPLAAMAPELARGLAPGGHAVLSGLLSWQEPFVLARQRSAGLRLVGRIRRGEWTTLVVRRG